MAFLYESLIAILLILTVLWMDGHVGVPFMGDMCKVDGETKHEDIYGRSKEGSK